MGWMTIWWIGIPVLLALFVWALLKNRTGPQGSGEQPEAILKRRYAKGEIDRDTYLRMRGDLKGG